MDQTGNGGRQQPIGSMSPGHPARQPPQEVELRLYAAPAVLDALEREPVIENGVTGAIKRKHQVGTYFDTADRRLERRGVNLRVRAVDGRHVQTIKADSAATPLSRTEWESDIAGPEPDLEAIAATGAGEATGVLLPGDLQALFVTDVHRTVRTIAYDAGGDNAALIEVSADRGEVRRAGAAPGDGPVTPISEMELELRVGPPGALFDLALALNERHGLRVGFAGKAARGYALLDERVPEPVRADKLMMDAAWTADDCMERVFRSCFAQWTGNERPAEDGTDPEGVHQLRVALRRLRSALTLFRHCLPEEQCAWLNAEAKWLAGSLGPARDWDVFLSEMLPNVSAQEMEPLLAPLAKAGKARQRAGYRKVRQAIGSPRYTRLLLEFWRWLEERRWRAPDLSLAQGQPITALADTVLSSQHRKVLKRGKHFAALSLPDRHRVRIAVKKLRYSVEFFASLYDGSEATAYRKSLTRLQDALGAMNDAAVAEHLLEEVLGSRNGATDPALARGAGVVAGWYARGRLDNDEALVEKVKRFRKAEPFWHTG